MGRALSQSDRSAASKWPRHREERCGCEGGHLKEIYSIQPAAHWQADETLHQGSGAMRRDGYLMVPCLTLRCM